MLRYSNLALLLLLFSACSMPGQTANNQDAEEKVDVQLPQTNWTEGETTTAEATATGEFLVQFETTAGNFKMKVHRDWAPRGAERFYQLVKNKYYDGAPFYRVMPGFMVQFGMCGDPKGTKYWNKNFPDEAVKQSNLPGLVSYAMAGPNTRSTQLFINYGNNARLDPQGFTPFAEVIEGMDKVEAINPEYGQEPGQGQMHKLGNKYVFKNYPNIDYIISAKLVEADAAEGKKAEGENAEDKSEEAADEEKSDKEKSDGDKSGESDK